ncbi:unnamed protein product [marine sediment metagenome]|uniref:Uncharacterized protein n=1 Tax=marine sediment metagenome TaxID=412755 RepID=X1PM40_9ZZZZ
MDIQAIFAAAESMGMADRDKIEQLTGQVIERMEQPQPFPGMEDLVAKPRPTKKRPTPSSDIQAVVRELLATEEEAKREEVQPKMDTTLVKPKIQVPGPYGLPESFSETGCVTVV